ncbi:MAG: phage holin family protein [Acidimicrobiales bacterium]
MSTVEPKQPERSLSELVAAMGQDLSTLMRKEVELAKEEMRVEVQKASKAAQGFGGAAGAGLYAGFALVLTLGFVLDVFLFQWLAFLIVTIVLGVLAAVFAKKGQTELKKLNPKPEETITTLKEDAQWLSEQKN